MTEGENMLERYARAADKAIGGVSLAFTSEQGSDTDLIRRLRQADTDRAYAAARAVIEALMTPTDQMVNDALSGWYGHVMAEETTAQDKSDMRSAIDVMFRSMIASDEKSS